MPDRVKPRKPWPQFPLTPHPSGTWCNKIKGKHHFGPWSDPDGALVKWEAEAPRLRAGVTRARNDADAQTLRALANRWLVVIGWSPPGTRPADRTPFTPRPTRPTRSRALSD